LTAVLSYPTLHHHQPTLRRAHAICATPSYRRFRGAFVSKGLVPAM
jgi:hypothetical protein